MKKNKNTVIVPSDIPPAKRKAYIKNILAITKDSGNLMLFAGDQKVEHLNSDFFGKGIHPDDSDPEHLFRIAKRGRIGVFATQLGLIARYGADYKSVNYLVKLNSKTDLVKKIEPFSEQLVDIDQVVEFRKNSGLNVCGVGYTIYLGSENEHKMLREASQIIYEAHTNGLIAVLWIYPRGKAVKDEKDPRLIAGATGVAACLGADFVKVSYPRIKGRGLKEVLREGIVSAGRTKVIYAGGASTDVRSFLSTLKDQLDAGAAGNATGRNIHQKGLDEAVRMCNAISALTFDGKSVDDAVKIYERSG